MQHASVHNVCNTVSNVTQRTIGQFKYIFTTVDDTQGATRQHLPNVTGMEEAVSICNVIPTMSVLEQCQLQ